MVWLALSGLGPIEEGVTTGFDVGGGELEAAAGCGGASRYRYGGGRGFVAYRPQDSALTLSAGAGGIVASRLPRTWRPPGTTATHRDTAAQGFGYLQGTVKAGFQTALMGAELGVTTLGSHSVILPLPTATARVHPFPRHSLELSLFPPNAAAPLSIIEAAYGYNGPKYRLGLGAATGGPSSVWAEFGYRLEPEHDVGLALHYFGKSKHAPTGAALLQYRWSTAKPRAATWQAWKDPDFVIDRLR